MNSFKNSFVHVLAPCTQVGETVRMRTHLDRLAVSIREAALLLGISPRSVQKYLSAKVLPARKIGRRTVIPISDLEAFIRKDQSSTCVDPGGSNRG